MSSVSTKAAALVQSINNFGNTLATDLTKKVPTSQVGQPSGVAALTSAGYVPLSEMDPSARQTGPKGDPGPSTYDLHNYINGKPNASEVIMRVVAARAFTCQANFGGSYAFATAPATNTVVIQILKNNVSIGTLTFSPNAVGGVFAASVNATFNVGDQFAMQMPAVQDPTLSDITISVFGTAS